MANGMVPECYVVVCVLCGLAGQCGWMLMMMATIAPTHPPETAGLGPRGWGPGATPPPAAAGVAHGATSKRPRHPSTKTYTNNDMSRQSMGGAGNARAC